MDALANRVTFTYNAGGQLATRTNGRGQVTTYSFDDAGRPTGQVYQDGTRVTVTYDNAGRQVTLQDVSGVLTYAYDDAGQLTAATFPGPKTLTYTFDDAGKRATLVDPDGGVTTFAYDSAARLTSLLNPFAERTTWAYDAAGQVTTMTLGNATETTFTFDDAGQVTGIHAHTSGGSLIQSFAYAYSDSGVRTGVLEGSGDRVTWSYDANWRLTRERRDGSSAYDITYAYDPVGSRLTRLTGGATTTYTYNAGDALTVEEVAGALTTYAFDEDGNTTVVNASGALTTMTWDGENRLSVIALSGGAVVTSVYDATGLRRQREDASGVTKYLWDGVNLLAETNSGGTTQARYTAALGQYGPVVSQRRSGVSAFYHGDALGTINRLTDTSQNVTDTYVLDAWGRSVSSSGSTTNPHRYVGALGYYTEPDLAMDYVRARWLRPATGSWVSVDPVEGEGYGYALEVPTELVDPGGLRSVRPIGVLLEKAWKALPRTVPGGRFRRPRVPRKGVTVPDPEGPINKQVSEQGNLTEVGVGTGYGREADQAVEQAKTEARTGVPDEYITGMGVVAISNRQLIDEGFGEIVGGLAPDPFTEYLMRKLVSCYSRVVYFEDVANAVPHCRSQGDRCDACCYEVLSDLNDAARCAAKCYY